LRLNASARIVAGAVVAAFAAPGTASAAEPKVTRVECLAQCAKGDAVRGGSLALLRGRNLQGVFRAFFPGGQGGVRELKGRASTAQARSVRVRIPWETVDGRFVVGTRDGRVSRPTRIRVAPIPVVSRWTCIAQCGAGRRARGGSLLLLRGVRLGRVDRGLLLGRRGRADDRAARVSDATFESVRLRVPATGVSGPLVIREASGASSPRRSIEVLPSSFFPVQGPHSYGGSGAQFGAGRGGRSHQGQDLFAACGTPLVAVRGGKVRYAGYQSAAGNYVVIDGSSPNWDYAYMHLQSPSRYAAGQRVAAGARLGEVGETGNAQGCHLHFELWSAPGWYMGGRPFDPLPHLRAWDRASVPAQTSARRP
jgi:murein DD-endopeptidase MepM/ murein hydrolase activator NlpD